MLRIGRWTGRFGNNVIQLIHLLWVAEQCAVAHVSFPPHNFFTTQSLQVDLTGRLPSSITLTRDWYYREYLPQLPDPNCLQRIRVSDYRRLGRRYILPILRTTELPLGSGDLHIHLRGGDIFVGNVHRSYVQPPFHYYRELLRELRPQKVLLVAEPGNNPMLPLLRQEKNVTLQQGELLQDIWTLIKARHVIAGYGTFTLAAFYLSPYIEHLWIPESTTREWVVEDNAITLVPLPNYILPGQWQNTPEQRKLMLTWRPPVHFRKSQVAFSKKLSLHS